MIYTQRIEALQAEIDRLGGQQEGAPGRWLAGAAGVDDFNVCQEMQRRHWGW